MYVCMCLLKILCETPRSRASSGVARHGAALLLARDIGEFFTLNFSCARHTRRSHTNRREIDETYVLQCDVVVGLVGGGAIRGPFHSQARFRSLTYRSRYVGSSGRYVNRRVNDRDSGLLHHFGP